MPSPASAFPQVERNASQNWNRPPQGCTSSPVAFLRTSSFVPSLQTHMFAVKGPFLLRRQ